MNIFSLQIVVFCFIIDLVLKMDQLKLGLQLIRCLNENGYEAYLVGGAVRDYLLGLPIHDVDICTNALPENVGALFCDTSDLNNAYLSCRVHFNHITFEVTTFRKDITYSDHRHPKIEVAKDLKEDVLRRDFTINALAMDADGNMIDYVDGQKDLENKVIKTIGNAKQRFDEDGLRVLRALDFSSRFDFELDNAIKESFSNDYLSHLPVEYIATMVEKIVCNPYLKRLNVVEEYQLLKSFPFYQVAIEHAIAYEEDNIYSLFYALHGFLPDHLKISRKKIKEAANIGQIIKHKFSDRILLEHSKEDVLSAMRIANKIDSTHLDIEWLNNRYQAMPIHSLKEIDFDFNYLPPKERSKAQLYVTNAILEGKILNQQELIFDYLKNEGFTL